MGITAEFKMPEPEVREKLEAALDCFNKSIDVKPLFTVYEHRVIILIRFGRFDEAERDCEALMRMAEEYKEKKHLAAAYYYKSLLAITKFRAADGEREKLRYLKEAELLTGKVIEHEEKKTQFYNSRAEMRQELSRLDSEHREEWLEKCIADYEMWNKRAEKGEQ